MARQARRIPRRMLLRGAGVALALPWLEAMVPSSARAQAAGILPRAFFVYFPTGYRQGLWTPTGSATDVTLPSLATALTPYKSKLSVITGAGNTPASVG